MQGSHKNRSTMDVLFKKIITYDISRQQRLTLAVVDNDAASCYDRILVNLASNGVRSKTAAILAQPCRDTTSTNEIHGIDSVWDFRGQVLWDR